MNPTTARKQSKKPTAPKKEPKPAALPRACGREWPDLGRAGTDLGCGPRICEGGVRSSDHHHCYGEDCGTLHQCACGAVFKEVGDPITQEPTPPVPIRQEESSAITSRLWGNSMVEVYTRQDGHSAYHVTLWGWLVDDVLMVASPSPTVVTKAQREHLGPDKGVVLELTCARIRW